MFGFYKKKFPAPPSLHARVLAFAVAVCLLLIAIDSLRTWNARFTELSETRRNTLNLARSLAQQAQDTIQTADILLLGLKERVETDGVAPPRLPLLQTFIKTLTASQPLLHSIFVVDADGHPIRSPLDDTTSNIDYSDRAYFQYHATHATEEVRVTGPLRSRADGSWIIVVSRRVDRPDGSFGGIVLATISADFFQRFYETVDVGQKGVIVLANDDATIIVRKPFNASNIGLKVKADPAMWPHFSPIGDASFDQVSPVDGERRLGSVYRLQRYPLYVLVAEAKSEALADWREEARTHLAGVAILAIILALFGKRLADQIRAAHKAEGLYRLLADHSTDAIICVRLDGTPTYISPSFKVLSGLELTEQSGDIRLRYVHPDDRSRISQQLTDLLAGAPQVCLTFRQLCSGGFYIWLESVVRLAPIGPNGEMSIVSNVRDISARKRMEEELESANRALVALTVTDAMTGIANRRKFDEVIEVEWARSLREEIPISLLLIDVDFFKKYNDCYGHQKGDECLRLVASAIKGAVYRPGDLAARIGGEEFAVILPRTNAAAAGVMAERISMTVRDLRIEHHDGPQGRVSVSIGIAASNHLREPALAALMQQADLALYGAKSKGRDRVEIAADHHGLDHAA